MAGMSKRNGVSNAPIIYSGLNVSSSQWNMPVAIFWGQRRLSTNAIDYDGFTKHKVKGKGKGGGGKGGQNFTYTADCLLGLCEGEIDSIPRIWASGSTTTTTTLAALNMTLFTGTALQTPWSFWETKYPDKARAYALTAYLGAPDLDLGYSATIPDNAFECVRTAGFAYTHSTPGWINPNTHDQDTAIDCLLSDIIPDLLTNVQYGMGWSSGDLGSLTQFAAYQRAQGLFFSPLLNSQSKATEIINRWAKLSNSWIYWSGTQMQFVPLGDSSVTGNGASYAPDIDVAYDLELSDLVADGDQPPVKVSRIDPADAFNTTRVSICDRTLGYIDNPIEYKDQTLVDLYGRRDNTSVQADDICDPLVGAVVAQLAGKRAAYIRNSYEFMTYHRFILCLPGTVLTIPLNYTGQRVTVRVKEIEEDDDGRLKFTCEEFPGTIGTYVPPVADAAVSTTSFPNQYASPPNVNSPAILELPASLTGNVPKLIAAASGGDNWGGCNVYLSFDGTAYSKIGSIENPAVQGVLTAGLAAFGGTNPDTGNTLSIDAEQSLSAPTTVTNADADALRTLSLVVGQPTLVSGSYVVPDDGELLAFGDVASTGTYTADLTYLQRGQYNTAAASHSTGDQFTVIDVLGADGTTVAYELPEKYIGQTLYVKFASVNFFGLMEQDLSTVAEYVYTPTGAGFGTGTAGVPSAPTGVTGTPATYGADVIAWSANAALDNVTAYSVWRASGTGAAFGSASRIWTGSALSHADSDISDGAGYTYFVTAINEAGESGASTGVDVTASSGGSSSRGSIVTKTANYDVTLSDYGVLGDAASGDITFTLPALTDAEGKVYFFKKIDDGSYTVTIAADGSDLIDGNASTDLSLQFESVTIAASADGWNII